MNKLLQNKEQVKKLNKRIIIAIIICFLILSWVGLTKAGLIPNYLEIGFLYPQNTFYPLRQKNHEANDDYVIMKPVIYLYPKQKQITEVKINYQGNITVSYPKYNNGWKVISYPDGKIFNLLDNKEYSYLFWEGNNTAENYNLSYGFIVKGQDTANFLQDKLSKLGLTPKEYNEFIVYWLPKIIDNKYNLIHFATKEEYDDKVILDIKPKPDSILRVFVVFKKLDKIIDVIPQKIKPFERKGFSVIEWGGIVLPD
ncbi:MAG: hypothetical protein NC935_08865 [Candidatus Omnitrophica bacterium]|nr:hypothetical protein [Candidatus Omnitrophota bacterium]